MATASAPRKQLTLFVTLHVAPENIEKLKTAHVPVWAACSREPECLLFDVFHDLSDPGRIRFVEVWDADKEWFETKQLTKPYYETLWAATKPLWTKEKEVEWFEREGEGFSYKSAYLAGGMTTG